jgi:hypothetical protein
MSWYRSANQAYLDLQLAGENSLWAIHAESQDGGFAHRSPWQNYPGLAIQDEMQMPTQQPRFEIAGIEERLKSVLRMFGLDPNRDGHRSCGRARVFSLGEPRKQLGVGNHQLFGFGDQLLQPGFLPAGHVSFAVLFQQFIESALFRGRELLGFWRDASIHQFRPIRKRWRDFDHMKVYSLS